MFQRNTLSGILGSFTKVQNRLDTYATTEETRARIEAEIAADATRRENEAALNAEVARRVSTNINKLLVS